MRCLFLSVCVLLVCDVVLSTPSEDLASVSDASVVASTRSSAIIPNALSSLISSIRAASAQHSYPAVASSSSSSLVASLSHSSSVVSATRAESIRPSASVEANSHVLLPGLGTHTRALPRCYQQRDVRFTQYWIPRENDWDESDEGGRRYLRAVTGRQKAKALRDTSGSVIANVTQTMWDKCQMEGTCLLKDGRLVNLVDDDRFQLVGAGGDRKMRMRENAFGYGSGDRGLSPFVSVAANDLPLGTTLYIPQLDGRELPSGARHNGCVRVDDSGSFPECQLDFFVVSYVDFLWMRLDSHVSPTVKACQVQDYVTDDYLAYIGML